MSAFTIYEKHPTADAYRVGGFYSPYALVATEKRFSEAELACEVLAMERDHWRSMANDQLRQSEYDRLLWVRKFATLPHFDA